MWPPQRQQGPLEGSHHAPGRQGDRTRVQLGLRHRPGYNSDSNPLSGFYLDSSYEFDFGSDPDEPESENNSTEQPLTSCRLGYNIYTRREICLLAIPQARRLDRRELTLRRLPRLTSLPGGNTACSSWGAHSNRGGNQRLQPWLSRPASLYDYQRDARALRDGP
jgi:hypothetical protein